MSNLPYSVDEIPYNVMMNTGEECEFLINPIDPLDDLWPLYQELLEHPPNIGNDQRNAENIPVGVEQQHSEITAPQGADKISSDDNKRMKKFTKVTSTISSSPKKSRQVTRKNNVKGTDCILEQKWGENVEEGPSSSVSKKLDHNAKERIRRMKLNASYLALCALLPDSRRSKKRWSAPSVVDKVLKYIPELETEIEELESKKEEMQSAANKNKLNTIASSSSQCPTVSVTEVNEDEAIIQICMKNAVGSTAFANMLQRVEDDEGICIKSTSTAYVCEDKITSHLHIQMNKNSDGANSIADLENKFISWLR